jgi:hypothetical protein
MIDILQKRGVHVPEEIINVNAGGTNVTAETLDKPRFQYQRAPTFEGGIIGGGKLEESP